MYFLVSTLPRMLPLNHNVLPSSKLTELIKQTCMFLDRIPLLAILSDYINTFPCLTLQSTQLSIAVLFDFIKRTSF